ncbi:MAG: protocatechuate 3,4-dioxygenase subunit beta [Acidocella sp.]|nr:protocatechuate 3,4-dioxygenase subunit beta [Acidocella sp.]
MDFERDFIGHNRAPGLTPTLESSGDFIVRNRANHPPAFTPTYKSSTARSPRAPLIGIEQGIGERTGPVFTRGILGPLDNDLIRNYSTGGGEAIGERIVVHGRIMDQNGRSVPNTLLEVWQANAGGRYRHKRDTYLAALDPNFGGCGRVITDDNGYYFFRTIRPGPYPWRNFGSDWRPAHIHFSVFGHAFTQRLISQIYFEGDPLIHRCPIVNTIPDKAAIGRLIAKLDFEQQVPFDSLTYRFDIVLRGQRSTFFETRPEGN